MIEMLSNNIRPLPLNMCQETEATFLPLNREIKGEEETDDTNFLSCLHCLQPFTSDSYLQRHLILSHGEIRLHGCSDCAQMFAYASELEKHRLQVHGTGIKAYYQSSEVSPPDNQTPELYQEHSYENKGDASRHVLIHSSEKPIQCKMCSKLFKSKRYLKNHMVTHSGIKAFKCKFCEFRSAHRRSLARHLRVHNKPFDCSVCGEIFYERHLLISHVQIHVKSNCQKRTQNTGTSLKSPSFSGETSHGKLQHFPKISDLSSSREPPGQVNGKLSFKSSTTPASINTQNQLFKCAECPRQFGRREIWLRHYFQAHRFWRPYECAECGMKFRESPALREHLLQHPKKSLKTTDLMKREVEEDKSDTSPINEDLNLETSISLNGEKKSLIKYTAKNKYQFHQCPMCRIRFKKKRHLSRHLDSHLLTREHRCSECPLTFARPQNLERHMLTHLREKKFCCSMCSAIFCTINLLGKHMRTHAGDRPYVCSGCSYDFRSPSCLKRHRRYCKFMKSELNTQPEDHPFLCTECHSKFYDYDSLLQHLWGHLK